MSPLPWSELRLDLQPSGCRARIVSRLRWSARPGRAQADVRGEGAGTAAIEQALARLRQSGTQRLPTRARLVVPDERVYYALLPADGPWHARAERARAHFAATLGGAPLAVEVSLLAGGRQWLAAAIERSDLDAWTAALKGAGVTLAHVHPALLEDLRGAAARLREPNALLVLMREEGATLLRIERGRLVTLSWERFDTDNAATLARRVTAFLLSGPPTLQALPVLVRPVSPAQRKHIKAHVHSQGWRLLGESARKPSAGPTSAMPLGEVKS